MNTFIETLKCRECGNNPTAWTKQLSPLCKEHGDTIIVVKKYLDGRETIYTK